MPFTPMDKESATVAKESFRILPLAGHRELADLDRALQCEWLLTNGLGGFASASIVGAQTRRYHGLLVAAFAPPGDRRLMLASLVEQVCVGTATYDLDTHIYQNAIHPHGFRYLWSFAESPLPTFLYKVGSFFIRKELCMVQGQNAVVVRYTLESGDLPIELVLRPLVNCRDYHHVTRHLDWPWEQKVDRTINLWAYPGAPTLNIATDVDAWSSYAQDGQWYYGFRYPVEERRGLESIEDHYSPGSYRLSLKPGQSVYLSAEAVMKEESLTPERLRNHSQWASEAFGMEEARLEKRLSANPFSSVIPYAPALKRLWLAASDYVVTRSQGGMDHQKSLIAGYPWFTDWGRDTMIALPGLLLVPGRLEDAAEILGTYAHYCKDGLIPNVFPEVGGPAYNTVDASLWYVYSAWKYMSYGGSKEFLADALYPTVKDIVKHYAHGTAFDIRMDSDGLITSGSQHTQLTWMDVKIGDYVPTPRHGKAVEINGLWYNALHCAADLADAAGYDGRLATKWRQKAAEVGRAFNQSFWLARAGYYADVVRSAEVDDSLRPNQLIASFLPHSPVPPDRACQMLAVVNEHLLTPYGLRSVAPFEKSYVSTYAGDAEWRDRAYHQGTVWAWLIGPYITTYIRSSGRREESRARAFDLLTPLLKHVFVAGIGHVSEIFEPESPYAPRGCFAQAWSVGEIIRAVSEDILGRFPSKEHSVKA